MASRKLGCCFAHISPRGAGQEGMDKEYGHEEGENLRCLRLETLSLRAWQQRRRFTRVKSPSFRRSGRSCELGNCGKVEITPERTKDAIFSTPIISIWGARPKPPLSLVAAYAGMYHRELIEFRSDHRPRAEYLYWQSGGSNKYGKAIWEQERSHASIAFRKVVLENRLRIDREEIVPRVCTLDQTNISLRNNAGRNEGS